MNLKRIEKLQALLCESNLDGMLYGPGGDMQYFLDVPGNYWQRTRDTGQGRTEAERVHNGSFAKHPDRMLYIPAQGEPSLIIVYHHIEEMRGCGVKLIPSHYQLFEGALGEVIGAAKRIAVGKSCDTSLEKKLKLVNSGIEVVEGERYGEKLRLIKDAGEIAKLQAVASFTDKAMGIVAKALVPGATPRDIQLLIARIAVEGGCEDIAFTPGVLMVQNGAPDSEIMFSHPHDRPMQENTAIGFDYGFVLDGYCSDYGRSFYCGKNADIKAAYKALTEAQLTLFDKIKPGEPMSMCNDVIQAYLNKTPFKDYLRKNPQNLQGHQIGIEQHERPWLRDDEDEAVFLPGMVMCVEPKIWWPGKCYLRCEDMIVITETGCRALTQYDRDHFEL